MPGPVARRKRQRLVRRAGYGWRSEGAGREWRGGKHDGFWCFLDPATEDVVGVVEKFDDVGGGTIWCEAVRMASDSSRVLEYGKEFGTLAAAELHFRSAAASASTADCETPA